MRCHGDMTRIERGAAQYWHCERCGAHAMIHSALRKVLVPEVWRKVWPEIRRATHASAHRCPSCRDSMEQTRPLRDIGGIRVDVCDTCDLIWLDPNELASLPKVPVEDDELSPEMRKALGIALAKFIAEGYDARIRLIDDWISNWFQHPRDHHWRDE